MCWHAECWFSSIYVICADNHNSFQFKLKGNGRSGAATQVVVVPVVQLHRCFSWFLGVHGLADPRHHGGEGVAVTAGACSQVFCHPIRCISGAWQDRLPRVLIIRTTNTTTTTTTSTTSSSQLKLFVPSSCCGVGCVPWLRHVY